MTSPRTATIDTMRHATAQIRAASDAGDSQGAWHGRRYRVAVLTLLSLAAAAAFGMSVVFGSTDVSLSDVAAWLLQRGALHDGRLMVLTSIRLPRAITALLAGAALGTSGLLMQTLFRNPLADPFALGVSSGASLGVALVVLGAGWNPDAAFGVAGSLTGDALLIAAATVGALALLAVVLAASARARHPATVLIVGLMLSYAASALVTLLVSISAPERLMDVARWGFGSFGGVPWERLRIFTPVVLLGMAVALCMSAPLNVLLLGETYARSMGVAVRTVRVAVLIVASTLGAIVTAYCGPLAFLGIAVPHLSRGAMRSANHAVLLPAVMLMGGIVALLAQTMSLAFSSSVVPLNAVTSLVGAPVVVAVLLRQRSGADL